jgi:hypothetical protein
MQSNRKFLPGSHKNGIEATLGLLDEALLEFEAWAHGRENRSVLYRERNTLSADQRGKILTQVQKIKAVLVELRVDLDLRIKARIVAKSILGQCSALWVSLVELESKHLRRYGEPPDGLAEYLDPKIAQLIDSVKEISKIAAEE